MNRNGRLLVGGIALVALLYSIYINEINLAIFIGGFITYLYWSDVREGSVSLAVQAFRRKEYEKTKILLAEIKNPNKLRKGRLNYYEFIQGNIALLEERYDDAEYHFQIASRLPWRKDLEKAMVLINLANINLRKKNFERVKAYISLTEDLRLTQRQIGIVQMLKNEIEKNK